MATVTVTHCAGGEHVAVTVHTAHGSVTRHALASDLLRPADSADEVAGLVLNNLRLRALKAKARDTAQFCAAVDGVVFQEP